MINYYYHLKYCRLLLIDYFGRYRVVKQSIQRYLARKRFLTKSRNVYLYDRYLYDLFALIILRMMKGAIWNELPYSRVDDCDTDSSYSSYDDSLDASVTIVIDVIKQGFRHARVHTRTEISVHSAKSICVCFFYLCIVG